MTERKRNILMVWWNMSYLYPLAVCLRKERIGSNAVEYCVFSLLYNMYRARKPLYNATIKHCRSVEECVIRRWPCTRQDVDKVTVEPADTLDDAKHHWLVRSFTPELIATGFAVAVSTGMNRVHPRSCCFVWWDHVCTSWSTCFTSFPQRCQNHSLSNTETWDWSIINLTTVVIHVAMGMEIDMEHDTVPDGLGHAFTHTLTVQVQSRRKWSRLQAPAGTMDASLRSRLWIDR